MSVVVTDTVQEEFSKPPPKKKWLQNYIEQDSIHSYSLSAAYWVLKYYLMMNYYNMYYLYIY